MSLHTVTGILCKGGGVGAYIKESAQFKRRPDNKNLETEFEHLWLEFPWKNKYSKLLIGTIYRSEHILETKLVDLLSTVMTSWDGLLLVTGDITICLLDNKPNMSNIENFGVLKLDSIHYKTNQSHAHYEIPD